MSNGRGGTRSTGASVPAKAQVSQVAACSSSMDARTVLCLSCISCRLSQTSLQLQRELEGKQMTLATQPDGNTGVVDRLLLYLSADNEPAQYSSSFDVLTGWVDNMLQMYKVTVRGCVEHRQVHI